MSSSAEVHELGLDLLYSGSHVIGIIPQSIVYGVYVALISITSYIVYKNDSPSKSRNVLFRMIAIMFFVSTAYMAASIANLIQLIQVWLLDDDYRTWDTSGYLVLFSALALSNYILTDCVVLWRAWVLCKDDFKGALIVCIFLLTCATLSAITTIGVRIALTILPSTSNPYINGVLSRTIDITQVAGLVLSLLTNLLSTSIVATKAWRYRQWFVSTRVNAAGYKETNAGRVMALLIESGIFYCLSLVSIIVAIVIPIRWGTLGDIYTPVNFQFAGMYPIVVLLLVNENKSLDKTLFANSASPPVSSRQSRSIDIGASHTASAAAQSSLGPITFNVRLVSTESQSLPQSR